MLSIYLVNETAPPYWVVEMVASSFFLLLLTLGRYLEREHPGGKKEEANTKIDPQKMVNSEVAPPQSNGTPAAATNNASKEVAAPRSATASPRHCAPKIDTKDRLFGATPEQPRKAAKTNATFKSNIFGPEPQSPAKTSKKQIPVIGFTAFSERNPITGEVKIPPRVTV